MIGNRMIGKMLSDDAKVKIKKYLAVRQNRRMLQWKGRIAPYEKDSYPYGINLIGDISAETGLGQSMRILASVLDKEGFPFCIKQVDTHGKLAHTETVWEGKVTDFLPYAVNLIHFIPGTWAVDYCRLGKEILDGRYNIAYWLWELETFPQHWKPCMDTVDEIWTPSEFVSNCMRKETSKPVVTVPYAIDTGAQAVGTRRWKEDCGRGHFGLPEGKFLFLMMYDFISVSQRKNPQAAVEAYIRAFPKEKEGVGFVLKINHAEEGTLRQLREALLGYKNIYFLTDNMTRQEVDALMMASDALVSLHRSEGFGLPVAEAMSFGKPVIATNWSATTEFMDEECACLVGYRQVMLEKCVGPYEKGSCWAEADIGQAADYMKRLVQDKEYYNRIAENAKERIERQLTYENAGRRMKERLGDICGKEWTDEMCGEGEE